MRRILALLIFVTLLNIQTFAAPERIILRDTGTLPTREGFPLGFDMPDVFYNHDEKTQDIIVDGNGAVSYYDVEISSATTNTVEMTTQVNGNYDTFDISSLPTGPHVITIESPSGNIYEGTFTKY